MCIVIDTFCTQKNLIITCAIAQFGIERTHTAPSHLHTQSPSLTHSRTHTLSHTMSITMKGLTASAVSNPENSPEAI